MIDDVAGLRNFFTANKIRAKIKLDIGQVTVRVRPKIFFPVVAWLKKNLDPELTKAIKLVVDGDLKFHECLLKKVQVDYGNVLATHPQFDLIERIKH